MPHPTPVSTILRDLSAAFTQQMFFWGMDAAVASGNLFQKSGFTKTPSPGLKGTSCYSLPWQDGSIFLHGACVGWLAENGDPGFIYIRPSGKCFLWLDHEAPVPGTWPSENLSSIDLAEDFHSLSPFIEWWLEHETWISAEMGSAYRINCHRKYKSLTKSKPWLAPSDATAWLQLFLENPATTPRAKHFAGDHTRRRVSRAAPTLPGGRNHQHASDKANAA